MFLNAQNKRAAGGAPRKVFTSVSIGAGVVEVNVSQVNKTATRLAEALWVSFQPTGTRAAGWRLRYYGTTDVAPTDVVEHGAVHLHALPGDGSLVYDGGDGVRYEIESLDVPVVSAGLLSPFPTAEDNSTRDNTTSLIESWIDSPTTGGWHWNLQNNIWNTNYPQWFRECNDRLGL